MSISNARIRPLSSAMYFVVAWVNLFFYADPYFCIPSRGQSRIFVSTKLALACSIWDLAAAWIAAAAFRHRSRGTRALVAGVIAFVGFASIPFWIYRGYGTFLFERTWVDVSCFFTEGSGIAFPFVVAPALAVATTIREWLTGEHGRKIQKQLS